MGLVTEYALGFDQQVMMLGATYGGPRFWCGVLITDSHSGSIRRALLCIGCYRATGLERNIQGCYSLDSRVRAWA